MAQKIRYTKAQLTGTKLAKIIDYADGDDTLRDIVDALRYHGMHVPASLVE